MRPGPKTQPFVLTTTERAALTLLSDGTDERLAGRAGAMLLCGDGHKIAHVARVTGHSAKSVGRWRKSFLAHGIDGLNDAPRSGRPKSSKLTVSKEQRDELERYIRRGTTSSRLATRSQIILRCAQELSDVEVAGELGVGVATVGKWRRRFIEDGVDGLSDADRPGGPRKHGDDAIEALIVKTLETTPKGATQWSTRSMAKATGMSHSTVSRVWRALGLKPHLSSTFQLSSDPHFIEKVRDVVGLYMNPPDNALVLCVDEKSQIQALNRTQPLLPLRPGQVERGTPEYQRNGTTTLFAALDRATGHVIGKCYPRHRAREFRMFLNEIRRNVSPTADVHIIVDNYSTHSAPTVKRWLAKNPRFHLHFIPTHSSWLNQVESWFSILTTRQIKRGSHNSVAELKRGIYEFLDVWNEEPTPFKWTKSADKILENVVRSCYETLKAHSGDPGTSGADS